MEKADNVDTEAAAEVISTGKGTERVAPFRPRNRSASRELTAVRHALMDVLRLMKQEGWIDILEEWEEP